MREYAKPPLNTDRPEIFITLTPEGRRIQFSKNCLEKMDLYRRTTSNGDWECIGRQVASPYIDKEPVQIGAEIEYQVKSESTSNRQDIASNVVKVKLA